MPNSQDVDCLSFTANSSRFVVGAVAHNLIIKFRVFFPPQGDRFLSFFIYFYVVTRTFLKLNGYDLQASASEKYQVWMQLADSQIDETTLAKWMGKRSTKIK